MQAALLYKEQIKEDILLLANQKKQKGSDRNILNKWFQDSIKNYFLETYASSFLKAEVGEGFTKKVKQNIEKQMSTTGLKFMNLLKQYKVQLQLHGKNQKFVNSLVSIIIDDQKLERGSSLWCKLAKKKFVALMIIVLMENRDDNIFSFYDMWNLIFPAETQIKKKLSKDDKMRLKTENNSKKISSIVSAVNSSTTLGYQQMQNNNKYNNTDVQSQCSRTWEFQEYENVPTVGKKLQIEALQQNQLYQQQPVSYQQISFAPSQQLQNTQYVLKQQEMMLKPHSNQVNKYIKRMSQTIPIKQQAYEQDFINLDEPQQCYAEELQQAQFSQFQQAPQTPIQFAQQPQFGFEQYAFLHLPQNQKLAQVSSPQNNNYLYNNIDLNNYFNSDQLFAQNTYAAIPNNY